MPTSDDLNRWIIAVARDADRQAFAALFKHFAPRVKSYLMRCGAAPAVAEELAQEAMVVLWRKAALFDPRRAAASTWVFAIARHLRVDALRRAVPMADEELAPDEVPQDPTDAPATPDDLAQAAESERGVRRALAELPPEQALVLRLSFFEEHPHARIAEQLGVPLGTVKSRIRLAVGHLRRLLESNES